MRTLCKPGPRTIFTLTMLAGLKIIIDKDFRPMRVGASPSIIFLTNPHISNIPQTLFPNTRCTEAAQKAHMRGYLRFDNTWRGHPRLEHPLPRNALSNATQIAAF